MSGEQIPREAKLISLLLTSAGVPECEPKVIPQLLEFMFRIFSSSPSHHVHCFVGYTTDVLQESLIFAEHAGRTELDIEDIRLGIQSQITHMFAAPPNRDVNYCCKL